jgi:hypothetical protein
VEPPITHQACIRTLTPKRRRVKLFDASIFVSSNKNKNVLSEGQSQPRDAFLAKARVVTNFLVVWFLYMRSRGHLLFPSAACAVISVIAA